MQFRLATAIIVFLGSYLPLSVILLAQNFDFEAVHRRLCWPRGHIACAIPLKNAGFALTAVIVCALCFLITLIALAVVKPKQEVTLTEVKYIPTDLMNYTLPYVVSFMSIDYQDIAKFVGLIIFLAWMFWITYRSGQIVLNPLLIVFGWRLYELKIRYATATQEHIFRALAKGHVDAGQVQRYAIISDILLIKPGIPKG